MGFQQMQADGGQSALVLAALCLAAAANNEGAAYLKSGDMQRAYESFKCALEIMNGAELSLLLQAPQETPVIQPLLQQLQQFQFPYHQLQPQPQQQQSFPSKELYQYALLTQHTESLLRTNPPSFNPTQHFFKDSSFQTSAFFVYKKPFLFLPIHWRLPKTMWLSTNRKSCLTWQSQYMKEAIASMRAPSTRHSICMTCVWSLVWNVGVLWGETMARIVWILSCLPLHAWTTRHTSFMSFASSRVFKLFWILSSWPWPFYRGGYNQWKANTSRGFSLMCTCCVIYIVPERHSQNDCMHITLQAIYRRSLFYGLQLVVLPCVMALVAWHGMIWWDLFVSRKRNMTRSVWTNASWKLKALSVYRWPSEIALSFLSKYMHKT